jgi:hypothetical protein
MVEFQARNPSAIGKHGAAPPSSDCPPHCSIGSRLSLLGRMNLRLRRRSESPITGERAEYLNSNPYKNTTINAMALRSAVGDCVEYHAPRWEEETGAHINITKIPTDADVTGPSQYDAYQTAASYYGDFFTSDEPAIVEIEPFLKNPRYPCWNPDSVSLAHRQSCPARGGTSVHVEFRAFESCVAQSVSGVTSSDTTSFTSPRKTPH